MFIVLYGQDAYRLQRKLKEIIEQYKKTRKSGLSFIWLEQENPERSMWEDFCNAIQQISMFGEKKMIFLSEVFNDQEFKEKFLKNAKKFVSSEEIVVFCQKGEVPNRDKLLKFLRSKAKIQHFQFLAGEKLKSWLKREFVKLKAEIKPEALEKLIDFVGNDSWRFFSEAKKLADFKKGKIIEEKDINILVKPANEAGIFKTIDALAQKNKKQALLLVRRHLEKGDNPLYLLSMINFQFRNLLMVKDLIEKNEAQYAIPKITGLHPFVVRKSCQQAAKFTFQELKRIYSKIFQSDLNIKTGQMSAESALDLLIAGD